MKAAQKPTKKFQRTIEDFVCLNCDAFVAGDGYRNHCPACLISRHVDIQPGDRAADCAGAMEVVEITLEHGQLVLTHACQNCGHQKRNRAHPEDNIDAITRLMSELHRQ